jgi:ribose transport system permease protein
MSSKSVRRLVIVGFCFFLIVTFGLTSDTFLTMRNILQMLRDSAFLGLIAIGMVFVVVAGGADLCAGSLVCFLGVIVARLSTIPGMPGIVCIAVTLAVGFVCGYGNGLIVTKLQLSDFVTTLATSSIFAGLAVMTTFRIDGNITSVTLTNPSFLVFGTSINGLYFITIAWVLFAAILQVIMIKTKFGRYTTAIGSHRNAAAMSGINIRSIKSLTYAIDGLFCGMAASFVVAYQCSTNMELGTGMEFKAMAACAVGGAVLGGGKGDPMSGVFGALFMTILTNGLYKWGLSTGGTNLLLGIVIVIACIFDVFFNRVSEKRALLRHSL